MRLQEIRPETQDALPIPDVVGSQGANQRRDRMEATCHIDAIEPLICSFSRLLSGLNDPSRPPAYRPTAGPHRCRQDRDCPFRGTGLVRLGSGPHSSQLRGVQPWS